MDSDKSFYILPDGSCSGTPRRPVRGRCAASRGRPPGRPVRLRPVATPSDTRSPYTSRTRLDRQQEHQESPSSTAKRPTRHGAESKAAVSDQDLDPWVLAEVAQVQELVDSYGDYSAKLLHRLLHGRRFGIYVPSQRRRSSSGEKGAEGEKAEKRASRLSLSVRNSPLRPKHLKRTPRVALPGLLPGTRAEALSPGGSRPQSSGNSGEGHRAVRHLPTQSSFMRFVQRRQASTIKEDPRMSGAIRMVTSGEREVEARRESAESTVETQAPKLLQGKTAVMVDSLQTWLRAPHPSSRDVPEPGHSGEYAVNDRDKAALRSFYSMARRHRCAVAVVHDKWKDFCEYDTHGQGYISYEQFQALVRRKACLPEGESIPPHLLGLLKPENGELYLDFETYLAWSISVQWTEEMQVNPAEREIRRIARDQHMLLIDVENMKALFDKYDTDGSGEIEEAEFRDMIYEMWNVKDALDLPAGRLKRFWHELDTDGSGSVNFEEFVVWYRTMEMGEA